MGLFHKEKTPEKALVDEIWEEIKEKLSVRAEKIELIRIVESAFENGASYSEIRRVYEENLPRYQKSPEDNSEKQQPIDTAPIPKKEKWGCVIAIFVIAGIIAGFAFLFATSRDAADTRYADVVIDGLRFYIPEEYELLEAGGDSICTHLEYMDPSDDLMEENGPDYYLEFYVFKNMNIDQAVAYLAFDDGWEVHPDVAYGKYTGTRVDVIVLPFRNTAPEWFIFEKDGKTVAVNIEDQFGIRITEIIN